MNHFCVAVFPFITLLCLHSLHQLLEKALWLAKISEPPLFQECLIKRLLAKPGISDMMDETLVQWFNSIKVNFLLMQNSLGLGDSVTSLHSGLEVTSILGLCHLNA